jgi:hypothetical protein
MKKEASHFTNKKRTPKTTRGSKDIWWKNRCCISRIRNTHLEQQGAQKTFDENGVPRSKIHQTQRQFHVQTKQIARRRRTKTKCLKVVDISYAAPQVHGIVNVALHQENSPSIVFIFFLREEGSLSCLRLTLGVTPMSTTRLYRGYVNWG